MVRQLARKTDRDNPSEDIDMHEDNKDYLFSFHKRSTIVIPDLSTSREPWPREITSLVLLSLHIYFLQLNLLTASVPKPGGVQFYGHSPVVRLIFLEEENKTKHIDGLKSLS